jgi:putative membrane protein
MGGWGWPMKGGYYGGYRDGWLFPALSTIIFVLVIAAIVRMIFVRRHMWNMPSQPESALEILKRRYASGEITKEEYEQKKRIFSKSRFS